MKASTRATGNVGPAVENPPLPLGEENILAELGGIASRVELSASAAAPVDITALGVHGPWSLDARPDILGA